MNLQLITETRCATCGAGIVMEACRTRHVNGQGFEVREFTCGRLLKWIPNFSRLQVAKECPKHPTETINKVREQAATAEIRKLLDTLDVSEDYRTRIKRQLDWR